MTDNAKTTTPPQQNQGGDKNDRDDDSTSCCSSEGRGALNWELLNETLGSDALEALKLHLSAQSEKSSRANEGACNLNGVGESADIAASQKNIDEAKKVETAEGIGKSGAHASATEEKSSRLLSDGPLSTSSGAGPVIPKSNTEYGRKSYWDERFQAEDDFEWLVSYSDVADQIQRFLRSSDDRILVVGCGNSSFSSDLYDAGYKNVTSLDYSETVINKMRERNDTLRPGMEWMVMDMTDMSSLLPASYDVVIDKAAMDALMTQEGDVWSPDQTVIDSSRKMCNHISRILKEGGFHLQVSFAQPHFRKKYLLGLHPHGELGVSNREPDHNLVAVAQQQSSSKPEDFSSEFGWNLNVETIGGDANDGCFHHFLYIMEKLC